MRKIYSLLVAMMTFIAVGMTAQVVTTEPAIVQQNSKNVKIIFHADQGTKGLMGYTGDVYAHTGVITTASTSGSDWKHAPTWGDNAAKYKMTRTATNTYELTIPTIAGYYGTTANETVTRLAFVFRSSDSKKEGKDDKGDGNIYVDVLADGFSIALTSSSTDQVITDKNKTMTFTVASTVAADITLKVNNTEIATAKAATSLKKEYTFPAKGEYTVTATATANGQTQEESLTYYYAGNSPQANYPGGVPKMGATANADGSVTFCLGAPEKSMVMIIGSWNDYKAGDDAMMSYQDYNGYRYFWKTIPNIDPTKTYMYYYSVDGTYNVGDPYARLILDPYNDKWINQNETIFPDMPEYPTDKVPANTMIAIYKGNINDYDWKVTDFKAPAKEDLIVYELLFRDFTGDEGKANANGTVKKAIEKLDYIKSLGVNAVELMPIQEFNGNNSWGYNNNFYFAPDKAYGTPDDYKEFIDLCHQEGIAVILDIVFNQSDGLHPWYQMYPIASNPFYNQTAPHDYSVLNDWRQDNPLVQQQWKDVLQYWLKEYKVDGFRFDLVKGLGDNNSYGNGTEAYNASRVARMKSLHAAIKEVNPNAYHINENLAGAQEENEMAADGQMNWANVNYASCQFAMGYSQDSGLERFFAQKDSRTWGSTVSYSESHDEERVAYKNSLYGASGIKGNTAVSMRRLGSMAAQMILAPGAHMIWQFGELGNYESTKKTDGSNNTDPKKVRWNYLTSAERKGLYDCYSELCWLRRGNADLFAQGATYESNVSASNWAQGRTIYASTSDKELICVINPNTTNLTVSGVKFKTTDNSNYRIASQSYKMSASFDASKGSVTVPANSYVVIVNNKISGIDDTEIDSKASCHVYGGEGRIVIEGEYENAEVYTVSGMKYNTLEVPAGFYIVTVDGQATKVLVK